MATIPKPAPAAKPDLFGASLPGGEDDAGDRGREADALQALGRSPVARPTATGMAAPAPAIGATMLIAPTAMPR